MFLNLFGMQSAFILDNSHEILLGLDSVCLWPSNSNISMHFVDLSSKGDGLVFMVCQSRDAMNHIASILTNLVMNFFCHSGSECTCPCIA